MIWMDLCLCSNEQNEKKFKDSKVEFERVTDEVIAELQVAWEQRFFWVNPVLAEVCMSV